MKIINCSRALDKRLVWIFLSTTRLKVKSFVGWPTIFCLMFNCVRHVWALALVASV